MGGKKNVQAGKWYPFLGIDPSGAWLMKGNEDQINSYYGSPALKAISELLDKKYGDVRGTTTEVGKNWEELCNFINQNLIPVENGMPDTIQKIDQLITQYIPEIEARFNNTYIHILPETTEVPDEDQEVVEPEEISPFTETLDQEEVKEQINQATLETNDIDEENSIKNMLYLIQLIMMKYFIKNNYEYIADVNIKMINYISEVWQIKIRTSTKSDQSLFYL